MKGITHFTIGVAVASCFPGAVEAGASGNPLYFILGGMFGLLPDTLDFKICRFFYPCDIQIVPDPLDPDPQMIADGMAQAVNMAFRSGRPVRIKLNTIQISPDKWHRYYVRFNVAKRMVEVAMGSVGESGASSVDDEKENALRYPGGRTKLMCGIKLEYQAVTTVDILDGPIFRMVCTADGTKVIPQFIPWHRWWTHSLVISLLFALAGTVLLDYRAGAIIMCAYSAHIVADQLGYMGSNLFFPFTKRRSSGRMIMHSGEALWNFIAVWLSCLLILWNLYCAESWSIKGLNPAKLLIYGALLPVLIVVLLVRRNLLRSGINSFAQTFLRIYSAFKSFLIWEQQDT